MTDHVQTLIDAGAEPEVAAELARDHGNRLDAATIIGGPSTYAFEVATIVREHARPTFLAQVERERAEFDALFGTVEEDRT